MNVLSKSVSFSEYKTLNFADDCSKGKIDCILSIEEIGIGLPHRFVLVWIKMASSKFCVVVGLIALAHAAYSSAQHRTYLRLTEQEFTMLPHDILVQCLIGLFLTCYGVVHVAGNFKEIRASSEQETKTWDMLSNRGAFNVFHHRGKAMFNGM